MYVYCIVPAGHPPAAGLLGVGGSGVALLDAGNVSAWVSPLDRRPGPELDALRAHNRVVESAMTDRVTPVPLRFGQWFADRDAAAAALGRASSDWNALLERFAGAAEYGLRILAGGATEREVHRAPASGGAAYLRARARARSGVLDEPVRALSEVVRARLAGCVRDERARPPKVANGGIELAHLVPHERSGEYRDAVDRLRSDGIAAHVLSSGPWPPYSFVT